MTEPITYPSTSPRFDLPYLFAGQAQKEFFVNSALQQIDILLHPAVEGETDSPPNAPARGECWLVAAQPLGVWADRAGNIACWTGEQWIFAAPRDGLGVYDKSTAQQIRYSSGMWNRGEGANPPSGGDVIDAEMRAEFGNLLTQLRATGVIS